MMTRKTRTLPDGRTITITSNRGVRKRCACPRRHWSHCPHEWHFSFKVRGGAHHRFPLSKYAELFDHPVVTKDDALRAADHLRSLIRAGKFPPAPSTPTTPADLTFAAFADQWLAGASTRVNRVTGLPITEGQQANDKAIVGRLSKLEVSPGESLGQRPIGLITVDLWEKAFSQLEVSASTRNKYRQAVLTMQEWAVDKGYLPSPWLTPKALKKGGGLARRKGGRRDRRLVPDVVDEKGNVIEPGEQRRLLQHASPWLYRLIVAALECGARRGELLALRWADVDLARARMTLRAENTKTRTMRQIPISRSLLDVLQFLRHDPAGNPHKPTAHVFGDAIGGRVGSPKKAWLACCRRAGITDLQFRDLRHECGSRLLESGWSLHDVREMLGHTNVATTSTYLNAGIHRLHDNMKRFGTGGQSLHNLAQAQNQEPQPLGNDTADSDAKTLVN